MGLYPFFVLGIAILFVIVTIVFLRIHAFLALMLAAVLVGILSDQPLSENSSSPQAVQAIEMATVELGQTVAKIGLVIALASIIGQCLMDSGAADAIARRFLRLLGLNRAPLALLGSGYVLSVPVFFDTVFYLLVPLAKAFRLRTGQQYVFYVMAICAGAALTHSLVAPTPGPLIMADNLHLDLGTTILVGLAFSILPAILGGWFYARWVSSKTDIPLRDTPGFSTEALQEIVDRPDSELPSFWLSILPIALPVLLIAGDTVANTVHQSILSAGGPGVDLSVRQALQLLGNRNFALFVSTAVAVWLMMRQKKMKLLQLRDSMENAIESAGVIILITSAGGAFGAMIGHAGIGTAIANQVPDRASGTLLLLLAFVIASVIKIAQGSGTVAIITASAIMYGVIEGKTLPFHPVYVFLAIGFGSKICSWMNDSGFWIVSRMSGFTEQETLRTWTLLLVVLGLIGLVQILIVSQFLPLKFLP